MRLDKPWLPLEESQLERIGAQLGVFELGDEWGRVLYIGAADGRSLFGVRGELERRIGGAARFRFEVNTAYKTRQQELLMVHFADNGKYPELNTELETLGLGRLS